MSAEAEAEAETMRMGERTKRYRSIRVSDAARGAVLNPAIVRVAAERTRMHEAAAAAFSTVISNIAFSR